MADLLDASALLSQFADKIRKAPEKAERSLVTALNKGGELARQRGIDQIHSELNLERGYIEKNLQITRLASPGDLRVVITGRARPTTLRTYGGDKIATVAAKSPVRKLKGDRRRRIARGQKAAGIKPFSVQRGGTATRWAGGFIVYLKAGNSLENGNVAMAIRTGKGRDDWKVVYGPSVGSAWKNVRGDIYAEAVQAVASDFQDTFTRIF